jgi:hypothetical protein
LQSAGKNEHEDRGAGGEGGRGGGDIEETRGDGRGGAESAEKKAAGGSECYDEDKGAREPAEALTNKFGKGCGAGAGERGPDENRDQQEAAGQPSEWNEAVKTVLVNEAGQQNGHGEGEKSGES